MQPEAGPYFFAVSGCRHRNEIIGRQLTRPRRYRAFAKARRASHGGLSTMRHPFHFALRPTSVNFVLCSLRSAGGACDQLSPGFQRTGVGQALALARAMRFLSYHQLHHPEGQAVGRRPLPAVPYAQPRAGPGARRTSRIASVAMGRIKKRGARLPSLRSPKGLDHAELDAAGAGRQLSKVSTIKPPAGWVSRGLYARSH